ncbi:HAD family hydrolase [Corynebacterium sp. TAE3-ERU12]|uniref:HAD family hydrolase n=1 Tax=Corynebacterium sp. TAE3-ERU12 TaxID=2849491 RepID=UPI00351D9C06
MHQAHHGREQLFSGDPLADLLPSQGAVRNFLENVALKPLGPESQRAAGEAAALSALAQQYDVNYEELVSGFRSVAGASAAASSTGNFVDPGDPDLPRDEGAAAFFDVDNTMIQGASIVSFGFGLAKRGMFPPTDIATMFWKQLKFRVSGSENADDVAEGREQALEFIKGLRVADVVEMAEEIFDQSMHDRIYEGTRELAEMHLQAGQEVWLVTATPVQLAQIIANRYGFTGALGTVAEVDDEGMFTGRLVGDILHGPGKKHAVAALAAYRDLDLARCTAYSDSANDVPMLSMVGTAVAVNPDHRLRAVAKAHDWPVREYRPLRRITQKARTPKGAIASLGLAAAAGAGIILASRR